MTIEPLGGKHDRAAFVCGTPALDRYLQQQARQDQHKRVAVVFVLTPDGATIAGYYTLSQFAVELVDLPPEIAKKLPKYRLVPATLLGRLAVSARFRGEGWGEHLLMDALYRTLRSSQEVAAAAIVVDAKDDRAVAFYRKYGFLALPQIEHRLFLPMKTVERMFQR